MIDTEDAIMCHGASDRALPSLHRMAPMVSGKGVFYTVCNGTCNTTTPYCSYCLWEIHKAKMLTLLPSNSIQKNCI